MVILPTLHLWGSGFSPSLFSNLFTHAPCPYSAINSHIYLINYVSEGCTDLGIVPIGNGFCRAYKICGHYFAPIASSKGLGGGQHSGPQVRLPPTWLTLTPYNSNHLSSPCHFIPTHISDRGPLPHHRPGRLPEN